MKSLRSIGLAAALVSTLAAGVAEASYPAGVWVKVSGVEFEPSAAAPTRIRIHGTAILYKGQSDVSFLDMYTEPARGVLYYECPAAQVATCRNEWNDIVANIDAPPEVCVGLGDQSQPTGTLHLPGDAVGAADVYPVHMGVLPGFTPCQRIREFLSDAGTGVGGSGSGGSGTAGTGSGGSGGAAGASASGSSGTGGGSSGAAGSATSGTGAGSGQGGTVASAAPSSAGEDGGCSTSAAPAAIPGWAAAIAALAALALGRRRGG